MYSNATQLLSLVTPECPRHSRHSCRYGDGISDLPGIKPALPVETLLQNQARRHRSFWLRLSWRHADGYGPLLLHPAFLSRVPVFFELLLPDLENQLDLLS